MTHEISKITENLSVYRPTEIYKVGAYTTLTPELVMQIEVLVKNGMKNVKIYETLGIPTQTWYSWLARNTGELADKIKKWRREYLLDASEQALAELVHAESPKIRLEAVRFITERLGKKWYGRQAESQIMEPTKPVGLSNEEKERLNKLLFSNKNPVSN